MKAYTSLLIDTDILFAQHIWKFGETGFGCHIWATDDSGLQESIASLVRRHNFASKALGYIDNNDTAIRRFFELIEYVSSIWWSIAGTIWL